METCLGGNHGEIQIAVTTEVVVREDDDNLDVRIELLFDKELELIREISETIRETISRMME